MKTTFNKLYTIPAVIVAITAVSLGSTFITPPTNNITQENPVVTDGSPMGYDFEYSVNVPSLEKDTFVVVQLPKEAITESAGLWTDDFGERQFVESEEGPASNSLVFKNTKEANYHLVYSSPNESDTLQEGSIFIIKKGE